MRLLIDGYNLLFASGILRERSGPGGLERARRALVNFLAESLEAPQISRTTVVFDAGNAPPEADHVRSVQGIRLLFARNHENADALIEELIEMESAPKQLTVISSDRRIQRAARKRRAKFVDSDRWYASILAARRERLLSTDSEAMDNQALSTESVQYWLDVFSRPDPTDTERS